ncbi:MAG: hypothetical protein RMX96_02805 [Nostoc sp. ChiSLP02]|nr:hypothetical protein [Nostoc sp. DedSLP05]MDZ8097693.1 hypothetical protein [Nostoc sp. DedSLP01]MDZ8183778.1 hypothetical protein [Nostoc sp. ChiSLP02]
MKTTAISTDRVPTVAPGYNDADRNAWIFGWNPQQGVNTKEPFSSLA